MNPILASEVYAERGKVRKLRIILISVVLFVAWCVVVVIVVKTPQKNEQEVHVSVPAIIPSSTPIPTGLSNVVPTMRPSLLTRRSISVQTPTHTAYSYNHSGGSYSMSIHTTSSASPVVIGGGGSNTGNNYSSHSNPSHTMALNMVSTSSMLVSPTQRLERHSLSAENTLQNMQQVIDGNGPNAVVSRMKKDDWDDYGQDEEPFLDPVGDVAWGWLLLLTIGWCARVHRKRQQACK